MHLILDIHEYIFFQCDAKTQYSYLFVSKDFLKLLSNILKSKCISLNEINSYLLEENPHRLCIFFGGIKCPYINSCELITNKIETSNTYIIDSYEISGVGDRYMLNLTDNVHTLNTAISDIITDYNTCDDELYVDIYTMFHILKRRQSYSNYDFEYAKTYCIKYVLDFMKTFSNVCETYKTMKKDTYILDIAYFLYFQLNILNINVKEFREMYFIIERESVEFVYIKNDVNAKTVLKIINLIDKMTKMILEWVNKL